MPFLSSPSHSPVSFSTNFLCLMGRNFSPPAAASRCWSNQSIGVCPEAMGGRADDDNAAAADDDPAAAFPKAWTHASFPLALVHKKPSVPSSG